MKKFFVEVLWAFVMFTFSLSLFSDFAFVIAILPFAALAIFLICAVTEVFVSYFERRWGVKWGWTVVLGIAMVASLPFYPSVVFMIPIYIGAMGYYVGRRLFSKFCRMQGKA
ncbi:hypothetical protein [Geobacillus zalihae]|uniref:hypothetical protein n=1 Tax=Geobacillus zalihae TaxID=213419 RepID=UPI00168089C4|nr:hypothetical protein [Geobacillus zalihae]QNU24786.1 hypothetical protein IC806_17775 [Geobacillus zalihae]QNU24803.1 hypothetical protein IC806_00045 [Geobacillus zalihae]QOR85488.1 hypothetical protein IMZ17_07240 [Geobacillus stearothermophilus]